MLGHRLRAFTGNAVGAEGGTRRWLTPLPFVALVAVLASTIYLAIERSHELDARQQEVDAALREDFINELEITEQHLTNEIDRLRELMAGIAAFNAASEEPARMSVDTYVDLTGAAERFKGLLDAIVVREKPHSNEPEGFAIPFDSLPPAEWQTELPTAELARELADRVEDRELDTAFLSTHEMGNTDVTVVTFPLGQGAADEGWAALVFSSDTFLARALPARQRLSTELINTGQPATTSETVYANSDDIPVRRTKDKGLTADMGIDVFGTEILIRSESGPGLVDVTSRSQVWILIGAGAAMAFAIYSVLRTLVQSRARAIESARNATQHRAAVDRRLRASFELSPIGMAELDALGRLVEINPALLNQVGQPQEAVLGRPLSTLVHEADREAHVARVESILTGSSDAIQGEHRFRHPNGRDVWVHESISVISSATSERRAWLVQCQDITAQRHAAWELAQQALHDELTGLPNRALFLNRLKHALVRAGREESRVAVMFIDIDRFKVINDSLGHDTGDHFLIQIAERIGTALRGGDTVARFGGDEFVVLCESVESESEASATAERIQSVFSTPFILRDSPTYATASIGITLSSAGESSADALLRDADAAMYRAKEAGRNRVEMFDHSMRSAILARLEIESQLRDALNSGDIVMHFQAIVDPLTHVPVGYEALIRWNHPEKGLLGPGAFLPVAEEAGLIHLIDSFALRATCEQIARWVKDYPAARNLYVATNWSARHLGRFLQQVEQVLAETKINPQQLVIEVTEGFLLEDSDASLLALQRLKQLGVQIAIDDFGTGYSSLSYLTQFAVDFLKIDQSFVSKLPDDEASAAVIGAIADMATRLGIKLVAEGVETEEQMRMLASLGAPRLQGYRFAKPRPAPDIEHQLALRSGMADDDPHDADADAAHLPWASVGAAHAH